MGILILLILASLAFVLAFVPRWREPLRWGRSGKGSSISRSGCLLLSAGLAMMAGGLAAQQFKLVDGQTGYVVLVAGFVLCLATGLWDQRKR